MAVLVGVYRVGEMGCGLCGGNGARSRARAPSQGFSDHCFCSHVLRGVCTLRWFAILASRGHCNKDVVSCVNQAHAIKRHMKANETRKHSERDFSRLILGEEDLNLTPGIYR